METESVQVQFPAGTLTVSPLLAEFIADWMSELEHERAVIVAACVSIFPTMFNKKAINRY
jgi:hypothetical protein